VSSSALVQVLTLFQTVVAASFVNTVILTSVLSAGNHALFAGTRVLYGLSVVGPIPHAPRIFSRTTRAGVPLYALLATSSISVLCFGSGYIGSGQLWGWLQDIVGVSNQVCIDTRVCSDWTKKNSDCLVINRTGQLEIQESLDQTGSIFRRNEVSSIVDLAGGPYFVVRVFILLATSSLTRATPDYHSDRSHLECVLCLFHCCFYMLTS
jgi:hypothetical protein